MEVQCPLCDKKVSYAGISKHLFSATHSAELEDLVLKGNSSSDLKLKTRMPLLRKDGRQDCYLCLGCKKSWMRPQPDHLLNCPNAKAHHALLSCWTGGEKGAEEVSSDQSAEVSALRKEVMKAKSELAAAKEKIENLENNDVYKAELGEAYETIDRKDAEIAQLKEGMDVAPLEDKLRQYRDIFRRLLGTDGEDDLQQLQSFLKRGGYRDSNPHTDLNNILFPTTSSAPPQPPPLPFQPPQPQPPQQDNPFVGKLLQSTKRPGKVLARC